jgi:hypothetical protein
VRPSPNPACWRGGHDPRRRRGHRTDRGRPLDRALFDRLGRERAHEITIKRVNRLYLFASTRQPVTMRQAYYHLDTLGLIAKTETGYGIVIDLMNEIIEAGIIEADWVVDLSREPLIWPGYDSVAHRLRWAADGYYKNLWLHEPEYVQVWIEKQGLISTIEGVCQRRCVSLWPAKGYASRSFLRRAVKEIVAADKPTFIYAFGDYDAAGWFASQHIDEMLQDYALREDFAHPIRFERVALDEMQIIDLGLPTRASKERDDMGRPIPSAPAFRARQERMLSGIRDDLIGQSCELDALDPAVLRGFVQDRITRHMSDERLEELEAQEAAEKAEIMAIVAGLEGSS